MKSLPVWFCCLSFLLPLGQCDLLCFVNFFTIRLFFGTFISGNSLRIVFIFPQRGFTLIYFKFLDALKSWDNIKLNSLFHFSQHHVGVENSGHNTHKNQLVIQNFQEIYFLTFTWGRGPDIQDTKNGGYSVPALFRSKVISNKDSHWFLLYL